MIGVNSSNVVSFLAQGGDMPGQRLEPKICEGWRCGRQFFRPIGALPHGGETLCPQCRRKEELRKQRMEKRA